MSAKDNSIINGTTTKKLNTPLKASVVLVSAMLMAACGTNGKQSYNLDDVFGNSQLPGGGASQEELEKAEKEKEEAEKKAEAERKAKEEAEKKAAEEKAKAEAAEKAAAEQKAKAEAAQKEAADAKAELAKIQAELEKAKKDLEDALASGSGNTEYFEKQVQLRENELKEAQAAVEAAEQEAVSAQQRAEAQVQAVEDAKQKADAAIAAAEIKNAPETAKSGVQSINVGASVANLPDFVVTTRDFEASDGSIQARADLASNDLLPAVSVNISGEGDEALSDGFMSHDDSTSIPTSLGELPFEYTSVYKDYDDDMRIGHIDGVANLSGTQIPVDGVAVLGNATQAANVPTEGTAGYTGDATHRKLGIGNEIEFGSSVFTADFVKKNLEGKLSFAKAGDIALKAGINGNQFSGKAADNAGYNTEGGFYGGDAQYIGGIYEGNGAQGTYGAKSDKQTAADKAAEEAQKAAEAAKQALAAEQAKAEEAKAAAEQAKADATEAQKALEAAEAALKNAGEGNNEQALKDALEKAQAEAEQAKADAEAAIEKAQAEAQQAVAAAQEQAKTAEQQAKTAQEQATAAKEAEAQAIAEKEAAEKEAAEKVAAAESAAEEDVAEAKKLADEAQAKAKTAQDKAAQAEADKVAAEKEAAEAEKKATAAAQAEEDAKKRIEELEAKLYPAEEGKSGVQSINVGASVAGLADFVTTTRDFDIGEDNVTARADLASNELLPKVDVNISGEGDKEVGINGFMNHDDSTSIPTALGELPLGYTSTYKDFGDEMRIAHIDGTATVDLGGGPTGVPVNGVAVVGNKTVSLPTEGTAAYAGDATNRKVGVKGQVEYGSSEFTADFVAKSLDGTLKFKQAGEIALSADIAGNEFSGSGSDKDENKYNTEGAFYGSGAKYVGGIYEGNGSQGTYGATKDGTRADLVEPETKLPEPPVNEEHAPEADLTGFQSNTLSSKKFLSITDDAIGYAAIRDDKSDFNIDNPEDTIKVDGDTVAVDNRKGDNFTSYDKFVARADMTKPDSVKQQVEVNISGESDKDYGNGFMSHTESTKVQGPAALDLDYTSVYRNFGSQMQIGHIYGDPKLGTTDLARVSNVFVQGNGTSLDDMKYMKELAQYNFDNGISDGMVNYTGVATYMENLHLKNGARSGPVVDGTSSFNVDFINNSVKGELAFGAGDYNYMPEGNKIGIEATIDGNTFKGNANNIDTAGGFYGEDAKFLGGIYQQALEVGGKGGQPGEGTTFQGTFGAEKK